MFKKIFNDFYIRISSKTVNIQEEDYRKMVDEIRKTINKYGVSISVFGTPEEFLNYIKRENILSKKLKKFNSFFINMKNDMMVYRNRKENKK